MKDEDEFIITGFQMKQLQDHTDLDFVCQAIQSRPAPSSTALECLNISAKEGINVMDVCRVCQVKRACGILNLKRQLKEHDTRIRKDERGKVLQGLLAAMNDPALSICDTGYLEHAYWSDYIRGLWEETKMSTVDLKEENKPGCFGAIGLPGKRNDPGCPCAWQERCRQSQGEY